MKLNEKSIPIIDELELAQGEISSQRAKKLKELASLINSSLEDHKQAQVVFICTHNSRRSQLAELWLGTLLAASDKLKKIKLFSGGTESTAFNHRMINALNQVGFSIQKQTECENPRYKADETGKQVYFSKEYYHEANPNRDFIAVMVCSDADENCPVVLGARDRFALPYNDPKDFDDTPGELKAYLDSIRMIGSEMYFLEKLIQS